MRFFPRTLVSTVPGFSVNHEGLMAVIADPAVGLCGKQVWFAETAYCTVCCFVLLRYSSAPCLEDKAVTPINDVGDSSDRTALDVTRNFACNEQVRPDPGVAGGNEHSLRQVTGQVRRGVALSRLL